MGAVLSSLNSVKEVVEDIDEASKESSEVTINIATIFFVSNVPLNLS